MSFSRITEELFIGPMPTVEDYTRLYDLGVRLVLNMRFGRRLPAGLSNPPMQVLWLRSFDNPLLPIPLPLLFKGAHAALEVIEAGNKVYTHCAHGRHRSVAMGAAILIAQGRTPEEAMALIKEKRPQADPEAFYIKSRILAFARHWRQVS
ncbi:MAG: dual specificity protein phosphatase family protein [Anaerolineales bacterium]|nr:dual specificity protein phosphatase family protein [Anaerolineales bacterium]